MVRLPQKQLHAKYGHPFTEIKSIHTYYRHKWWWRLVCLATNDRNLDLNWSSHFPSQILISPRANPSERVSIPTHGAAWPSHLWGSPHPGLNSAGCLQIAFSKTGGIKFPTWFLGERRLNETAQLSFAIGLRPWISFPSEGVARSLRGNDLRFRGRVGRCVFMWRGLGRRQYAEHEQIVPSPPSNQSSHGVSQIHKNKSIRGRSLRQQEGVSAEAQMKFRN